ncbi:MarR family transcriptional regulator [Georgenia sp. 311]|uniref:MarR family winged helix-turn-helix transcriptional regulator n=1 Tax=Georgenia sp. 311 TaxID=2585134 RepID=UPI0011124272|nr:MarR family transcriptional regulator [Georgenia sp. 311]TNC19539.1 MarR family transcriptional regulator [Georgenia sp. 311]
MTGDTPRTAVDLLDAIAVGFRAQAEAVLREHDLTYDQWRVLERLALAGPRTMRELRTAARLTGPTLTRVVDRLAETALVYRDVDAADRRRVVVHVSERGRRLYDRLCPDLDRIERDALAPLSSEEARTLGRLLERLSAGR